MSAQDAFAVEARTKIPEAFTQMKVQKHDTKINETYCCSLRQAILKVTVQKQAALKT